MPQLIAEDDYLELVASALPGATVAAGRRFAALALARLCEATSSESAVDALDLGSKSVARRTTLVADPEQLWPGIAALAERLPQRGPVDYQARRQALAGLVTVPADVLAATYRRHGQPLPPARSRLGVSLASWLWAELTSGSLRDAPALEDPTWSEVHMRQRRKTVRQVIARLPGPVAADLRMWGEALLA